MVQSEGEQEKVEKYKGKNCRFLLESTPSF